MGQQYKSLYSNNTSIVHELIVKLAYSIIIKRKCHLYKFKEKMFPTQRYMAIVPKLYTVKIEKKRDCNG